MDTERQRLINEAARILGEINQQFINVEYWNTNTRVQLYPDAEPINPDPDGSLAMWKAGLTGMLRHEATLGNFPRPTEGEAPNASN